MRKIYMRPVPGTDYQYYVDNYGRVTRDNPGRSCKEMKWMRSETGRHPYVILTISGKKVCKTVPTLVAMAFIPNPDPDIYTHACCKNMDPNDVRVENIEWMTRSSLSIKCLRERDGLKEDYTSQYHGVYRHSNGLWYVELKKHGERFKIGPFDSEEEALEGRMKLEMEYPELTAND